MEMQEMPVNVLKKTKTNRDAEKKLSFLIFIPCLLIGQTLDNDIWFLLNSGRYVLENGLPTTEPFTIHQGLSFVMQQWLSASLFWAVYSKLGAVGLFALVTLFYGLIILTIYKICMLISQKNFLVSFAVTLTVGVLISFFMQTRPFIISSLLIVLEVFFLESFIQKGKRAYLYFLPLLSLLGVNFHAAMWPMLFVVLIPYWADSFQFRLGMLEGQGYAKKPLFIVSAIMLAAGLINPYGLGAMRYLFQSYGHPEISALVREMLPANINQPFGKIIFGSMFAVILVYGLYQKGRTKLRYILLTLGVAFLALSSIRGFLFFGIFGFFPLSFYCKDIEIREKAVVTVRQKSMKTVLIVSLCLIAGFGLIQKYNRTVRFVSEPDGAGAVDYLLEHADIQTAILYTHYDVGGYAEYMGFKCYIDPRAEVFVKKNNGKADIMAEFYQLQKGYLYCGEFLQKYDFTHLLVPRNDILYVYLPNEPDYRLVYEDGEYRLFERRVNG